MSEEAVVEPPDSFEALKGRLIEIEPTLPKRLRQAAAYALEMVHEAGIWDIDQWFSDYAACDEAYLLHYYRTGTKGEFRSFWRDNVPQVQAKPVPPFTPTKRRFRMEGVVI